MELTRCLTSWRKHNVVTDGQESRRYYAFAIRTHVYLNTTRWIVCSRKDWVKYEVDKSLGSRRLNSKPDVLSLSLVLSARWCLPCQCFVELMHFFALNHHPIIPSHPHRYKSKLFYFNPWMRRNIRLEITCIHSITERGTSLRKAALSYWFREENPYSFTALNTEHYLVLFNFSLFLFFPSRRGREREKISCDALSTQTDVRRFSSPSYYLSCHPSSNPPNLLSVHSYNFSHPVWRLIEER